MAKFEEALFPIVKEEESLLYKMGSKEVERGCIGWLRGYFAHSIEEKVLYTTWFPAALNDEENNAEFSEALGQVIDRLRDNGPLSSKAALRAFCSSKPNARVSIAMFPQTTYGFALPYGKYMFYLRFSVMAGEDYNLYCYCYKKETLVAHLRKAQKDGENSDSETNARQ